MVKFSGSTITVVETDKLYPPPALSPHTDSVEFKNYFQGFPGWFGNEESACQFKRYTGFDHWSGKIPHASGAIEPCTTNTEAMPQSLGTASKEPTTTTEA